MAKKPEVVYEPGEYDKILLEAYDVIVVFDDGTEEVIPVQGRGPLGAIYTAAMSRRRDWSVEKQNKVIALRIPGHML